MKTKKEAKTIINFEEPIMIEKVAIYGGSNGKHLIIEIPDTMNKKSLYNWKERNYKKLKEVTKVE